jgi:hypothetical protein
MEVVVKSYTTGSGGRAVGREDGYSPPSSAQVKDDGAILPIPKRLHGLVLQSHKVSTIY